MCEKGGGKKLSRVHFGAVITTTRKCHQHLPLEDIQGRRGMKEKERVCRMINQMKCYFKQLPAILIHHHQLFSSHPNGNGETSLRYLQLFPYHHHHLQLSSNQLDGNGKIFTTVADRYYKMRKRS